MFYENENLCFRISNVFHVKRKKVINSINNNRKHSGIAFRLSGSTVFESCGQTFTAEEGSLSFVPAGVDFVRNSSDEELIIIHLDCFGETENEIQIARPNNPSLYADLFFKLVKEWNGGLPGYRHRSMEIFCRILEELQLDACFNPETKAEQIIKNSISYMCSAYDNPLLTVSEIAEKSNISEVYFRKLYKEVFGITPGKAIIKMRIQKAKNLLSSGYFTVSEVAEKSGFYNVKYFSTLFKKQTGKTPFEYKEKFSL